MNLRPPFLTPSLLSLSLFAAPLLSAKPRTWKSVTGKFSLEAEFVEMVEDKVKLRTAAGAIKTVPLDKLSDADRKFLKDLEKKQLGDIKITATARKSEVFSSRNGKTIKSLRADVKLEFLEGLAKDAFAVASVKSAKAIASGEELEFQKKFIETSDYYLIDRAGKGFFKDHPANGIWSELIFKNVTDKMTKLDSLSGSVIVLTGGTEREVIIEDPLKQKSGPINSPILKKAGLDLTWSRAGSNGFETIEISRKVGALGFAGIALFDADGDEVKDLNLGTGMSDKTDTSVNLSVKSEVLKGATLMILIREGCKKVEVPFELTDVPLKKR